MTNEQDFTDYESGPFCRHFSDPSDCEIECDRCGDRCGRHDAAEGSTECNECECPAWVEPEE